MPSPSWPPRCFGQVMPSHPFAASFAMKARLAGVSTSLVKFSFQGCITASEWCSSRKRSTSSAKAFSAAPNSKFMRGLPSCAGVILSETSRIVNRRAVGARVAHLGSPTGRAFMKLGEIRHPERAVFGKPLDGVRVLALEQMQALPYATQLMAHLGAEVVKVEPPGRGDSGRAWKPAITDADGRRVGATYLRTNLSKQSIAVDFEQEGVRELVRRLVPHFDVVAENYRAGALARRGLGYSDLAKLRPGLVYVSISGFGQDE